MKKMFKALLISLITFLPVHAKITTRAHYARATQKILRSYYDSLSTVAQSRTFDPFTALNIGSHDPDEENVLKTQRSKIYKKLLRAMRSSLSDLRSGGLKAKLFFKSKEGRRITYETGFFAAIMAGGYKVWLQNERANKQHQELLFELTRTESRNAQRAKAAQAERAQLRRSIAALEKSLSAVRADADTNKKTLAALRGRLFKIDQRLQDEADKAPRAYIARGAQGARNVTHRAAVRGFDASQAVGRKVAATAQLMRKVAGVVHEVHTSAWNVKSRSGDAPGDDSDTGAAKGSAPKVWQPTGAGRLAWEHE